VCKIAEYCIKASSLEPFTLVKIVQVGEHDTEASGVNGKHGKCLGYDPESAVWIVLLHDETEPERVKPGHVKAIESMFVTDTETAPLIDVQDRMGGTALHDAIYGDHLQVCIDFPFSVA
jgi:hypothetical protein